MSEDNGVQISFDDECRIRVLDPEQFKHSEMLEEECRGFVDKMREFNTSVHGIVEVLHENAARIDKEKLRAIGQRNKVRARLFYTCFFVGGPQPNFQHRSDAARKRMIDPSFGRASWSAAS